MFLTAILTVGGVSIAAIAWLLFLADGESPRGESLPSETESSTTPRPLLAEPVLAESKKRAA
jgi:hypothetical protein